MMLNPMTQDCCMRSVLYFTILLLGAALPSRAAEVLPAGVQAVWDLDKAHSETTPTRERVCLNGLWKWQPGETAAEVPTDGWGYFKVPGAWPGITDYMQKDSQTVFAHPDWKNVRLANLTTAWYEREFTIPANWAGRKIALQAEYVNSFATVYVDGKKAGEMRFPAGEVDVTKLCRPGATHRLSVHVIAMPLKGVMLSYVDSASAREVKGSVARRGLCGDVFLVSTPPGPRLRECGIDTSVRRKEIAFHVSMEDLAPAAEYQVQTRVLKAGRSVKVFSSKTFKAADLKQGTLSYTNKWMPAELWDTHTPNNKFTLEVSLLDVRGGLLDKQAPVSFGFRELWIDGKDFYLNGTRIFLSALPLDNAQVGAALANYAGARESMERLKSFGINFVYTHNYDCLPGSHLGFEDILKAADDTGMLVSFTQPHFSHYDWKGSGAEQTNGYAGHAAFYVGVARNHPSVVMYSMSHNGTGYNEDMNPDLIDGLKDSRGDSWSSRNANSALKAEAIVKELDPARVVYHHASGNLGSMHPINFYPNFVPIQELSDWFTHWSTVGVKPVFLCEYGAPFTWDWTMYRGWYQGKREFGSAVVPWEFCVAEWNAQFMGGRAYQVSEAEKANLRWEAKQFRDGKLWHRWDYPHQVGSSIFDERYPIFEAYFTDNWRAFRTMGVSAISPWEHGHFWKLRPGVQKARKDLPVDWANLQRPGFSPDYIDQQYERMDLAFDRADWIATPAAQALLRNNMPLLGYVAGKSTSVTSKDHIFTPGEALEKQLVVINNSREPATCELSWELALDKRVTGTRRVTVAAGQQERIPVRIELPRTLKPAGYELQAAFRFRNGETQRDAFSFTVIPQAASPTQGSHRVAVFDPKGETTTLLHAAGLRATPVSATSDLAAYDILVVGKSALTLDGPAPDITRVRDGLKVVLFEQTSEVLEKRFGFRVTEYGLRQAFPRVPDHPALAGLGEHELRDWRGEATLLPAKLKYELNPKFNGSPTVTWCGIPVTRLWRCGNRGSVASVLIEKPARGDFLPIIDGGYSLQYSPLMEYREGKGMVLFCQMDVTGRTEEDPAAVTLARNVLRHVENWKPMPPRTAIYAGDAAGKAHLEKLGLAVKSLSDGTLAQDHLLVLGPGAAAQMGNQAPQVAAWLRNGGRALAIGVHQADIEALLPSKVTVAQAEHISCSFESFANGSALAGISPADVHNRDPRHLPLVKAGAQTFGDGVLAQAGQVVFCQMPPWLFDPAKPANHKRTHRRASVALSRLLGNMGVAGATPLLARLHGVVDSQKPEQRWLEGFYLDTPEEWDDPYRFFRW